MRLRQLTEDGRIVKGVNTTVDVGPNEIPKQAKKWGFKVDKDGRPPTLSKKVKVLNLLSKGEPVSWKVLRSRFDLTSPRAMIDQLRSEGNMVYINKTDKGTSYRLGTPTKSIIAAGIRKLYGPFKYAYSA